MTRNEKIIADYRSLKSYAAIARKHNLTRQRISDIIKANMDEREIKDIRVKISLNNLINRSIKQYKKYHLDESYRKKIIKHSLQRYYGGQKNHGAKRIN